LQRHYARIMACFGGLLLLMAVLAPILSPADQRGEIIIMTILFGLIGALMLYMAIAPGGKTSQAEDVRVTSPSLPVMTHKPATGVHLAWQARQARRMRLRAWAGAAFGLFFALAGAVAPFALSEGAISADARFLMVIGFAPVVISGVLMVGIFSRTLLAHPERTDQPSNPASEVPSGEVKGESILTTLSTVSISSGMLLVLCALILPFVVAEAARAQMITTAVLMMILGIGLGLLGIGMRRRRLAPATPSPRPALRRAPVPRVPPGVLYRVVVPALIALAVLLIVAVIAVVILATAVPFVR
jgi:hypothetical protein